MWRRSIGRLSIYSFFTFFFLQFKPNILYTLINFRNSNRFSFLLSNFSW